MMLFFFLFGLALVAVSSSKRQEVKLQRGNCPMFWYSFKDRCYKYIATQMSWTNAEFYCRSEGTNLVSIHSLDEDNFVKFLIKNFDPAQGYTWIGMSDAHQEATWMWSDGSTLDFANWREGQPDNYREYEHCAHTNYFELKWNDCLCTTPRPFVCATRIGCPCQKR